MVDRVTGQKLLPSVPAASSAAVERPTAVAQAIDEATALLRGEGSSLSAERLDWLAGRRDPIASKAQVIGLTKMLDAAAKEYERTGPTKKMAGRIEQVLAELTRSGVVEVTVHAGDEAPALLEAVFRWLRIHHENPSEALAPLIASIEHRFPGAEMALAKRQNQELILERGETDLSRLTLEPGARTLAVWHDGPLAGPMLRELLEKCTQARLREVSVIDAESSRTTTLTARPDGRWSTTATPLAEALPEQIELALSVASGDLKSALKAAPKNVALAITLEPKEGSLAGALETILSMPERPALRLLAPNGQELAAFHGSSARIADPAIWADDAAASLAALTRQALGSNLSTFRITGAGGFERTRGGITPWRPGDGRYASFIPIASVVLASVSMPSSAPERQALEGLLTSAMRHASTSADLLPIELEEWRIMAAAFARAAGVHKKLLFEVVDRIERHSERASGDGFGIRELAGQAREANAFHLLSLLEASNDAEARNALEEARGLLGPAGGEVVLRGAPLEMLHHELRDPEVGRRRSAHNEKMRLLELKTELLRAAKADPGARYELVTLPHDRTHGKRGKSATPDFVVTRSAPDGTIQALFVDAKEMDGQHLAQKGDQIAGGVRQVLDNRFYSPGARHGMLALHFRTSSLNEDVDLVRRLVKLTPIANRGPLIVRISASTPEGVRRVTLDSRRDYAAADPEASLFEQIGWVGT